MSPTPLRCALSLYQGNVLSSRFFFFFFDNGKPRLPGFLKVSDFQVPTDPAGVSPDLNSCLRKFDCHFISLISVQFPVLVRPEYFDALSRLSFLDYMHQPWILLKDFSDLISSFEN